MTGPAAPGSAEAGPRWAGLLSTIRLVTAATAAVLLSVHDVTDHDGTLVALLGVYTAVAVAVARRWPAAAVHPAASLADVAAALALVWSSGDWRSPFYLLAVTTLAAPSTRLRVPEATLLGGAFSLVYVVMAHFIGPDPLEIGSQTTLETLATHLVLPVLVCFGVSYASDAVRRLRRERRRSERLAIEAERQRIAWELHDSAKQRVHAAHLLLSAVRTEPGSGQERVVRQGLGELQKAGADMETSVAELRSPLEGRPLALALRMRAAELQVEGGPDIVVEGETPPLDPLHEAHAYRIAAEAVTNAVRHAAARRVLVRLSGDADEARVVVTDDGSGMPEVARHGANGVRSMRNRAASMGARLEIGAPEEGTGTRIALTVPRNGRARS